DSDRGHLRPGPPRRSRGRSRRRLRRLRAQTFRARRARSADQRLSRLEAFDDDFGLEEQLQVVWAAGFGVGATHVEAAEWLGADERAGDLAVQVQIANLELGSRLL